jgi:valyl-tRNA synthetase
MIPKRYDAQITEPTLMSAWDQSGVYHFDRHAQNEVYAIDTPPPTVSGNLHLGHVYSYSHTDFVARFWRMQGKRVFYPMGFDDNGLPTERLVEKRMGILPQQVGRQVFIEKCEQISIESRKEYEDLWRRLGLSVDWRYTYRTIDDHSRKIAQLSFLMLYEKGLAYHKQSPAIWCPECQTSIAQAELNDLERDTIFDTLDFAVEDGGRLSIATTRPELLPACVAVFVHPSDSRYRSLVGKQAQVPMFKQWVPILEDANADPEKGTGAVMCCTFGDVTDVNWWSAFKLPFIQVIDSSGRMTEAAQAFAGLPIAHARQQIRQALARNGFLHSSYIIHQSIRVHERCDTPVEYLLTRQWFVNLLDHKSELLALADQLNWYPASMKSRYIAWVENLGWDWCLSRQRFHGVPFPVWYCQHCDKVVLALHSQLPVDPMVDRPLISCPSCSSQQFSPEEDVFDTWATSSNTPQIVGGWLEDEELYRQVFPFNLRPHAHDIIRTWTFYTLVKNLYLFGRLPWNDVAISGWGVAGAGLGKISKSRGGGPASPEEMIKRYSADAVRYWAASTGPGKDAVISEEKFQAGSRLVTKLWNVARFSERFIREAGPEDISVAQLSPADRWILAGLQRLIQRATVALQEYDYALAKNEIERFFWGDFTDNYLEMCKQRLYETGEDSHIQNSYRAGAVFTLREVLKTILHLFAPFLPYITESIYQELFLTDDLPSIHINRWPQVENRFDHEEFLVWGERLVEVATAVRRYKSEHNLALGSPLLRLQLSPGEASMQERCQQSAADLRSITRAEKIEIVEKIDSSLLCDNLGYFTVAIDQGSYGK